ncbi:hypothetical protein SISNIDRAFT_469571 [Sistotremastrum niveocremeum HHB9708]|uniref:Uncharacterized protein n=1 Tax=Sistotremastrum niveocremeum HHB9708 TaxID=1314777 RepID=A0A164PV92_9AGAM|nr:hypothetical protein SISNIDRAFT_469571 [Sistotremastrum niveocremeum HHB9708]
MGTRNVASSSFNPCRPSNRLEHGMDCSLNEMAIGKGRRALDEVDDGKMKKSIAAIVSLYISPGDKERAFLSFGAYAWKILGTPEDRSIERINCKYTLWQRSDRSGPQIEAWRKPDAEDGGRIGMIAIDGGRGADRGRTGRKRMKRFRRERSHLTRSVSQGTVDQERGRIRKDRGLIEGGWERYDLDDGFPVGESLLTIPYGGLDYMDWSNPLIGRSKRAADATTSRKRKLAQKSECVLRKFLAFTEIANINIGHLRWNEGAGGGGWKQIEATSEADAQEAPSESIPKDFFLSIRASTRNILNRQGLEVIPEENHDKKTQRVVREDQSRKKTSETEIQARFLASIGRQVSRGTNIDGESLMRSSHE